MKPTNEMIEVSQASKDLIRGGGHLAFNAFAG
jgi:hypothetical protein